MATKRNKGKARKRSSKSAQDRPAALKGENGRTRMMAERMLDMPMVMHRGEQMPGGPIVEQSRQIMAKTADTARAAQAETAAEMSKLADAAETAAFAPYRVMNVWRKAWLEWMHAMVSKG